MVNLRLQKRLAASVMKCGRRKVWLDPNEMNEVGMASTRQSVRKLIQDGFIIKKPQKIHSRFTAKRRKWEKKRGRHKGPGKRKGTKNARMPFKRIWMVRIRALRRLLKRYRESGKINKISYKRYYLRAKGNAYKNKAALIDRINYDIQERQRSRKLLEQYKVRRAETLKRKKEKAERKKKLLDEQLKIAMQIEEYRRQQTGEEPQESGDDDQDKPDKPDKTDKPKRQRRRARKGKAEDKPKEEPKEEPKKKGRGKRRRKGGGGSGGGN